MKAKLRFEVLKRDLFTCGYCGRTPPSVLLHVDHIVPKAAGGTDDLSNLSTSCVECNQGKGSRSLQEGVAPSVNANGVAAMRERIAQAKEYQRLLAQSECLLAEQTDKAYETWCSLFGGNFDDAAARWLCNTYFPESASLRRFIRDMPFDMILENIEKTASRWHGRTGKGPSLYFYKLCWNDIREANGESADRGGR